jgi:hypothetical protein
MELSPPAAPGTGSAHRATSRVALATRSRISSTVLAALVYGVNIAAIAAGISSGYRKGDLALRFQEKQSITFFSSNQLAMTALLGLVIYLLRRHVLGRQPASVWFWLLSAAGFFYLMLDESFQFHEGMDSRVLELVDPDAKNPRLDGLSTAFYGLVAFVVCWIFRAEVARFTGALVFFGMGGLFLAATSAANFGHAAPWRVVLEESCKLLGVASFLLAYVTAFLHSMAEVESRAAPSTADGSHAAPLGPMRDGS